MKNSSPQAPPEWLTKDIYLAAAIKQAGIPIVRVENHAGRGIFVFRSADKIRDLISDYFNGDLRVDPKGLFETWKALKAMAFSTIGDVK